MQQLRSNITNIGQKLTENHQMSEVSFKNICILGFFAKTVPVGGA